jgi:hypothetical protein
MVMSLTHEELPSLIMLANPSGDDGAVPGMAGPADGKPTEENMLHPMEEGQYVAISPASGICSLRVERIRGEFEGLSLAPEMLEAAGLNEQMLAKYNGPAWRVILTMEKPGKDVRNTVVFATRIAQRLATLADGVVMDTCAYRFFGPDGWPVEDPNPEFDVREHVHIHMESESNWFHTHGLIKFGRPELEIYDVPPDLQTTALGLLLDTAQYVITATMIEPKQTCGDPSHPFYAREGTKNREEHWNDIPVLEFVDLDERRKPVPSGAPKALRHFAAS